MTRRPALRHKQPPHGIRPERVDRQPVQRIGWHRDDGAVEDPVRGFADGVTLRRLRIDEDAAHSHQLSSCAGRTTSAVRSILVSTIVFSTVIASSAIRATLTMKTMRTLAPLRKPAM